MTTRQPPSVDLVVHTSSSAEARLTVAGEIDIDSAPRLRGALTRCLLDGQAVIDVDLAGVTFCDCSGLHVFVDIAKAAALAGGILRLHEPSGPMARLIALTGTGTLLLATPAHAAPDTHQATWRQRRPGARTAARTRLRPF